MHSPAHLVLNLTVLGKAESSKYLLPTGIGALLPDAPMFVFYLVERFALGTPNQIIWRDAYFDPGWQNFIDAFNSVPLVAVGLAFAWKYQNQFLKLLCLSMLLHFALDLPLHHDDAHRHLFPLLDWRYQSAISYWDPRHYGRIVSLLEAAAVLVCCYVLFRRHDSWWLKGGALGVVAFQIVDLGFGVGFYL